MTRTELPVEPRQDIEASPAATRCVVSVPETASPKIQPYHLERLAIVYVRQSSPQQVINNRESRERQYALADRAVQFGWPRDRVLVIDEDQGRSAKYAENRMGFQQLLVEVNLDHVGLILSLEMTRLARSNKDWHHLLEVTGLFRSLLADSDGLYDPNDPNDRMLLGLKGMISEVELHTLRNRLTRHATVRPCCPVFCAAAIAEPGWSMVVAYKRNGIRYGCVRQCVAFAEKPCQYFKGNPVEELVQEKVLRVLEPAALKLSLKAAEDTQQEQDRLHQNWQQRLERAHYETERAQRQYDVVEPENRLVARALEQRWESALRDQQQLKEEYDRFCQKQPQTLSAENIKRIRSLASDIPRIWNADETTAQDRKTVVRHLIDRVIANVEAEYIDVTIHWAGGYVSGHEVKQPVGSFDRMRDFDRFKQRVLALHFEGRSYPQICDQLSKEKFHSPTGQDSFRPEKLRTFLFQYCREELGSDAGSFREFLCPNEWLVGDLSRELNISQATLQYWRRRDWVHGRQLRPKGGRWIFWADVEELERLRQLRQCPINYKTKNQPYPKELVTPKPKPKLD